MVCFVVVVGGVVFAACDSYNRLDRLIFLGVSPNCTLSSSYKVIPLVLSHCNCRLRLVVAFKYSICIMQQC